MRTIIYLCRHADYENPRAVFHGRLPGFPLSQKGKEQAKRLAAKLKDKPLVAVYSSPLIRALDTARIVAAPHRLKVTTDDRLMDLKSPLQGKTIAFMESINWNHYRPEYIRAGGEKMSDVYHRMHEFLTEKLKIHRGEQLAVFSHGDPIMIPKMKYLGKRLSLSNVRQRPGYIGIAGCLRLEFDARGRFISLRELDKYKPI